MVRATTFMCWFMQRMRTPSVVGYRVLRSGELEIRLLMQMSANDSTHLVDSVAASHLGAHVMLLRDDASTSEARFRPYSLDSLTDLVPVLT